MINVRGTMLDRVSRVTNGIAGFDSNHEPIINVYKRYAVDAPTSAATDSTDRFEGIGAWKKTRSNGY